MRFRTLSYDPKLTNINFKKITFYKSKKYLFDTAPGRHSMFCKV